MKHREGREPFRKWQVFVNKEERREGGRDGAEGGSELCLLCALGWIK